MGSLKKDPAAPKRQAGSFCLRDQIFFETVFGILFAFTIDKFGFWISKPSNRIFYIIKSW